MSGKVIIFSAPSGTGKTTIVHRLLKKDLDLEFSISATSRNKRPTETDGVDYYFLSTQEMIHRIADNQFLEHEEVYAGTIYGTLKSEVERIFAKGNNVVFDVDVVGGLAIKKYFGNQALAIFVEPPSIEVLRERLEARATDAAEVIDKRVNKAAYEISFAKQFDIIVVNHELEIAIEEAYNHIVQFVKS